MLLQNTSEKFKELFLLAFTREIIIHSSGKEILELESKEFQEDKEKKQTIKQIVNQKLTPIKFKPLPRSFQLPRRLIIPTQRFPQRLQHIKPVPTQNQIELGKLNPILQDPMVQTIECHGPDKEIIVRAPNVKKTNIKLTKEEINTIVDKFTEKAKIPNAEGVFRVAFGKLIFSAIISEIIGTKFTIKKIPMPRTPTNIIPTKSFGMPIRR